MLYDWKFSKRPIRSWACAIGLLLLVGAGLAAAQTAAEPSAAAPADAIGEEQRLLAVIAEVNEALEQRLAAALEAEDELLSVCLQDRLDALAKVNALVERQLDQPAVTSADAEARTVALSVLAEAALAVEREAQRCVGAEEEDPFPDLADIQLGADENGGGPGDNGVGGVDTSGPSSSLPPAVPVGSPLR